MTDINDNNTPNNNPISRRKILKTFGIAAFSTAGASVYASENSALAAAKELSYRMVASAEEMKHNRSLKENDLVRTTGFYKIGDGGHAEYIIQKTADSDGGSLALTNGLHATLINVNHVNYRMFGALGDSQNDDGVQIKAAHNYANKLKIPVINLHGEFWLKATYGIQIMNNVEWGNTVFHIEEKFNTPKGYKFQVVSDQASETITLSAGQKDSVLRQLKPGVKIIPELAPYKNSLVIVTDKNDRIGFRAGPKYNGQSWSREEFFYVEEHGRIIGDIAWEFKDYTSLVIHPVSDRFLTVNGGTFYLSGDSGGTGYTKNGFGINRSRTIIKNQWVGLEKGKVDIAPNARSGFYSFSTVFDVTLENIRLIPYEQDREGTEKDVPAGTYGISAGRMLNGTFRNVTAEGGPIHWGVFGTNLNKNFRIENCRLNRVDVHFHCWNLYIIDTNIGYRGISVTGGGDLFVQNSTCENASFINFRRDFGAKWDGNIRISNCRFMPSGTRENAVLNFFPADFDYKYPIGFGRSIIVENLAIDYTGNPFKGVCWLIKTPDFSKMKHGERLFFPKYVEFRNILVSGRQEGVKLMKITDPRSLDAGKEGSYDGIQLKANSRMLFENIQLQDLNNVDLSSEEAVHIRFDKKSDVGYDAMSLYPEIQFVNCNDLAADFGDNIAGVSFEKCSITRLIGKTRVQMPGRFTFSNCYFQPASKTIEDIIFALSTELGTSFTNCTIHSPRINGVLKPELLNRLDFIQINKVVRFNHLNTLLGRDIINYYRSKGITFNTKFISMLKSHHELESESV
ncbi:MAG TPA: hypothetical protein VGD22_14635 [Sphingobacteriaceae bacterium]